jgi:hypothetical protein
MQLKYLLWLQLIYGLLGTGYNLTSIYLVDLGGSALSPTNPLLGVVVMLIYLGFLSTAITRHLVVYRLLMTVAVIVFGYTGVVKHIVLMQLHIELYSSYKAGISAILINIFGSLLNFTAAAGLYRQPR